LPIRIYALAKQLKLDSKVLVDICTKAGVTGKGSALASLTDEETAVVKEFLAKGPKAHSQAPAPMPMTMPTPAPAPRPIPVLPSRPHHPAPTPAAPAAVPPSALPSSDVPPVDVPSLAASAGAPVDADIEIPAPESAVPPIAATTAAAAPSTAAPSVGFRREDYLGPGGTLPGKIPVLPGKGGDRASRRKAGDGAGRGDKERTGPAIKLAPMPAMQPPPSTSKSDEPAPQKPDIKLPLDAIRASKAGDKPLSEHIRKTELKRKEKETAAKDRGAAPPRKGSERFGPREAPVPGETPDAARARGGRTRDAAPVAEGEEEGSPATLGGREHRQLKRKRSSKAAMARRAGDEEEGGVVSRRPARIRRTGANTAAPRKTNVVVELPVTVRGFSEAIGVPARTVLGKMLTMGIANLTINAELSAETAELLAMELGVEVEIRRPVALEDQVLTQFQTPEDDPDALEPRPPIVTFLGHVDHGKTSLLDRIIGINVAAGEKGGITQHIRAYRIEKDGRAIAFVDTPGHEAFTEMRARGAHVTDIAVLVVAADDGVMPQTEEAISHARAAGVPIVVALNKIDLPGVNIDRIFQQLAANELLPSQWGGDVEVVQTSATTGRGMDELLETLLTVAELHEYKANPRRPATGTCLEAELHEGRGVVAKMLVQNGTLRVGDVVLCGPAFGRVKAMYDTLDPEKRYEEAGPSTPVNITGLGLAPGAGDSFYALDDVTKARELAETRAAQSRQQELSGTRTHVTLENLFEQIGKESEKRTLNIILRADVRGSIEAIRKELTKLDHPEVQIKILQATVGGITEADVHLADASDAVIIGFNVVPDEAARVLADQRGVQVRRYDIIYQITQDLKAALEGMLKPEKRVLELGRVLVQRTFHISRVGTVAGCRVMGGTIQRDARIRVIRDSRVIGDYGLESLKREKDDAREVREGMECGMKLAGFDDVKEGDVLEAYKVEEVRRTF